MSPNKTARIAGFLYGPLMVLLAPIGIIYVPTVLVVTGDALTTTSNIIGNMGMFRLSIVAALIVQVVHIFIVILLYKLLKPVDKNVATLMAILILVSLPITMLNELNHYVAILLLNGTGYMKVFTTEQIQALVLMFHEMHEFVVNSVASIFWGLWLFPMGYLVFKSRYISKIPGILLLIAGCAYLIDSFSRIFFLQYGESVASSAAQIAMSGEIIFPFWLLLKGVNIEEWNKYERNL